MSEEVGFASYEALGVAENASKGTFSISVQRLQSSLAHVLEPSSVISFCKYFRVHCENNQFG